MWETRGQGRRTGPLVAALEVAAVWVGSGRERMAIRRWATTGVAPQREGEEARVAALESSRRWARWWQHCTGAIGMLTRVEDGMRFTGSNKYTCVSGSLCEKCRDMLLAVVFLIREGAVVGWARKSCGYIM